MSIRISQLIPSRGGSRTEGNSSCRVPIPRGRLAARNAKSIYLDHAAATPLDPQVLAAMQPYFGDRFYNPSSPYRAGRQVRADIEAARARTAHWLGAKPADIIFTAGATEAVNLAVNGVMRRWTGANLLVGAADHAANLAAAAGYPHTVVPVLSDGIIRLDALQRAIDPATVLISLDYANSELGTIQPAEEISALIRSIREERQRSGNTMPLYLHLDASQAAGYLSLQTAQLGADLMTIGAGKIYGPKQSGALFVKPGINLAPLIAGGGQELGLRSGTENVPSIIGLSAALDLAQQNCKLHRAQAGALRDDLQRRLLNAFPGLIINGNPKKRLPNLLNVSWPGVDAERLLMQLDDNGVQVSTGAACAANSQTGSHVLVAIGLDESARQGSLRFSLGHGNTADEIAQAASLIIRLLDGQN